MTIFSRIGAAFYIAWALLHLFVAYQIFTGTAAPLEPGTVRVRVEQTAIFMTQIALLTIWSAVVLNWRSRRLGYWLSLFLVSWADGWWLILHVLPGQVPLAAAWPGLATWAGGVLFTTLGLRADTRSVDK